MRILLLSGDRKTAQAYAEAMKELARHRLCTVKNIPQAMEHMFREAFDALITDDPGILLPMFQNRPLIWPDHIFLLMRGTNICQSFPEALTFCLPRDTDPKTVIARVVSFPKGHKNRRDTDTAISFFLQKTGVPVSLSGFDCLREAIRLILNGKNATDIPMQDIYELVSAAAGTNPFTAEHAMRHAIETAWIRADMTDLEHLFGYTVRSDRGVPSNAAFLFRAADQIKIRKEGE